MSNFDAHQSIGQGLRHLASRLDPILAERLAPYLHGHVWTVLLEELDISRNRRPGFYSSTDLQAQLRILTERLGQIGYPLDNQAREVSTLGQELRLIRNHWAHNAELDTLDAWRAHDFSMRLLSIFSDIEGVKECKHLADQALCALIAERGDDFLPFHLRQPAPEQATQATPQQTTPQATPATINPTAGRTAVRPDAAPATQEHDADYVQPDEIVKTRTSGTSTPTLGSGRYDYEPWEEVIVGDATMLDSLRTKKVKETVRAIAAEIAEFEGPIHVDRLVRLVAQAFQVGRLSDKKRKSLERQVRQCGLNISEYDFVWPSDLTPDEWNEFRPNTSEAGREFTEISPVEIANAYIFLGVNSPELSAEELDAAVLRTFGRKRRTKLVVAHLEHAKTVATQKIAE